MHQGFIYLFLKALFSFFPSLVVMEPGDGKNTIVRSFCVQKRVAEVRVRAFDHYDFIALAISAVM